jgi:hypothetical protein
MHSSSSAEMAIVGDRSGDPEAAAHECRDTVEDLSRTTS